MKRIFIALLSCALLLGVGVDAQAQTKKKKKSKAKTTATTGKKKSSGDKEGKKKTKEPPAPTTIELPYNSNDCLFAIPLEIDKPFGPTSAPDGAGRIQEVVADKANPNLFEREHNSVWYKVSIPYNGLLEISIAQTSQWDDYDFLVYKNTGQYFSNQVMLNKVKPAAIHLAGIDSAAMFATVMKTDKQKAAEARAQQIAENKAKQQAKAQAAKRPADEPPLPEIDEHRGMKPTIGMLCEATDKMLTKKQTGKFIKSIPVRMGEEYYIVLDNCTPNGQGHTITVSVHADAYEPLVLFYDKKGRKYVDVDLMILERGGKEGERTIVKDEHYRGGRVKFVPDFSYLLYAKKDGYFSIYREFNSRQLMLRDTVMLYHMERTERGTTFPIRDIYFESGEATLIGNYDSVLNDYLAMFRNHPEVQFLVKCNVQSYGVNVEEDMLLSLERAKSIKSWFVKNGIDPRRISTSGMTKNEIKRTAAAALNDKGGFSDIRAEIIITGRGE
ncbi:MAG: OmpA family protein [Bacteroidales bacterium]|nr:OmpA family protein [Bacteroidales bacterium]